MSTKDKNGHEVNEGYGGEGRPAERTTSIILSHYIQLVQFWLLIAEKHIFHVHWKIVSINSVFIEMKAK